ncbi:hypothetical protein NQ317_002327 [Molorchus minor]|uniref:Uncharacterized protein n=1 Tax=Molorchus minor TaxID=1323400 RepID=A0ABQ9J3Y7_9CUCU|nr:hypothetical protein NQ317_002327 [Molorchus minor]
MSLDSYRRGISKISYTRRWFAGSVITAAYVPLLNYHSLFPDAVATLHSYFYLLTEKLVRDQRKLSLATTSIILQSCICTATSGVTRGGGCQRNLSMVTSLLVKV